MMAAMRSRLLTDHHGTRTFAVALETGDRLMDSITRFAADNGLAASEFTAIGALASARLAYFDPARRDYVHIPVEEQVEIASLNGRITRPEGGEGDPHLHVHCVLSRRDGSAVAGHLVEAEVRPTAEVFVIDSPGELHRRIDPESGLAVIDPELG
jgi:predicted DNA-binding protein with PD1-like motif